MPGYGQESGRPKLYQREMNLTTEIDCSNNSIDQLQSLKALSSLRNISTRDSRKNENTQKATQKWRLPVSQ